MTSGLQSQRRVPERHIGLQPYGEVRVRTYYTPKMARIIAGVRIYGYDGTKQDKGF